MLTEPVRGIGLSADGQHVPLQIALAAWAPCEAARCCEGCWQVRPGEEELGGNAALWLSPPSLCVMGMHPAGSGLRGLTLLPEWGREKTSNCVCAPTRRLGNKN